jgi:hypothetical protein
MGSKTKQTREGQKTYWETKLNQRISVLAEKSMESEKIARDPGVRKIRARIRQAQGRLKAIVDFQKKAEKMAAPKKDKKEKEQKEEPDTSKRKQKKMKKMERKDKE